MLAQTSRIVGNRNNEASQEKRGAVGEQRETQGSEGTPRDLKPGGNLHPSALDDIDSILEELEDKG